MINDGVNNVPDNKIAVFNVQDEKIKISDIVSKPSKKRSWFHPWFYRCIPLTIGNQYGFVIKNNFPFEVVWNGGSRPNDVKIFYKNEKHKSIYPKFLTHFGSGILTLETPFVFRTPPGVNIMTINPPNFVVPNMTVMTGVVEADNLRYTFTFNLKIQVPHVKIAIPADTELAAFIPIPRYFADKFDLVKAEDLFDKDIYEEEITAYKDAEKNRHELQSKYDNPTERSDSFYSRGIDVYGNKFKDHQNP
jgi:hypothetical protein